MTLSSVYFPPRPARIVARSAELRALEARIESGRVTRLALVGGGGSGKSLLACALGHRLRNRFEGGAHWLRVGGWDTSTLLEMLARRLGSSGGGRAAARVRAILETLAKRGRTLIVLDNHENDRAMADLLDSLRAARVMWVITARRCLLSGVEIFPVVPPFVTTGQNAFPRVAALTELLRWNPLALDVADGLVGARLVSVAALRERLIAGGVERVSVMDHEDDVAEVRLLVDYAWSRLSVASRRMLAVLSHSDGDDMDAQSLARLAGVSDGAAKALESLRRLHLVQEPLAGRFTVHAVVRHSIARRTRFDERRFFRHYVALLERDPSRIALEQTHLFAAMDQANASSDLGGALRIERLLSRLDEPIS